MITGGSQGLGEAMGVELAKRGADILLVSRSEEKLKVALSKVEVVLLGMRLTSRLRESYQNRSLHTTAPT
jgi:short-subunit dehydrogenase